MYFTPLPHTLNHFFYIISFKILALAISCEEFLYACITDICCQSIEPVFNHLLQFYITHHVLL